MHCKIAFSISLYIPEKYNLLWEWKTAGSTVHQGNNITFLGQSKGYGPEVYVSFNKSGEYVLTVTHPQTKATSSSNG